jgi:general secretion pathway protein K
MSIIMSVTNLRSKRLVGMPYQRAAQVQVRSSSQKGAALLLAMLTVTLVASLASAAMWQQWRGIEIEQAERGRVQSGWILVGALDWARLILREDARTNQNTGTGDHLAEPWAIGLAEARLSSFLAADANKTTDVPPAFDAFLSGDIEDLQSKLNFNNLVQDGKVSETALRMFVRLYEQLGLNPSGLSQVAQQLLLAQEAAQGKNHASAVLVPNRWPQVVWLGVSPVELQRLAPFTTWLPERTAVNVNTAPLEVLVAALPGLDRAQAQRLVDERALKPFKTLVDVRSLLRNDIALRESEHSTTSRYFHVNGRLRLGEQLVQEQSVVVRDGLSVKALARERSAVVMRPSSSMTAVSSASSLQ